MRKFLIAGNWKLNKGPKETQDFLTSFLDKISAQSENSEFILFPPALVLHAFTQSKDILKFGLQNIYSSSSGAFTGENSVEVLKEMGGSFVLVGHSERRAIFKESLSLLNDKVKEVSRSGLTPVICVGENLEQRQAGKVFEVLKEQLTTALAGVEKSRPFHIAYEPVWAIGTGKVATANEVNEAHQWIRDFLNGLESSEARKAASILYGGSVKPKNAKELSKVPEVGGFLIGGASLDPDIFWDVHGAVFS